MSIIYLDFNRTTPTAPSVQEAMQPYWSHHFYLPGQHHPLARAIGESLEQARESVSFLVGCDAFELVFTGSGTEANNLAILGATQDESPGHILVSSIEHESVILAAESLVGHGWQVDQVPCDCWGQIHPDSVAERLRENTALVCVQLANPVMGTIQAIRQIADVCHKRGVRLHCDATQAFGKIAVDAVTLGVDTMSISGHKFYGPRGSGALYLRGGLKLSPITYGESREMGLRPGAENIPAWVGMGVAASLVSRCIEEVEATFQELQGRFVSGLLSSLEESVFLGCEGVVRLPNTLCVELPVLASKVQEIARDLVVRSPEASQPPCEMTRVLAAAGRSPEQIARTVQISLGWTTSREQIDRAVELLADACDSAKF
ncbi:MAG: cysteine desulfurase [Rhodopirellula sp.]|nr:cysteine desulfurase [Rhodopirellula sp.]